MKGKTALNARNYRPVLIDAETSRLTAVPNWPISLSLMYLTQPLHYGNYAGLTLKIIWGVFDIIAIVILVSGLYLWIGRRGSSLSSRVREVADGGEAKAVA
jgi:uncharacterized iron-regulated membrane protein